MASLTLHLLSMNLLILSLKYQRIRRILRHQQFRISEFQICNELNQRKADDLLMKESGALDCLSFLTYQ